MHARTARLGALLLLAGCGGSGAGDEGTALPDDEGMAVYSRPLEDGNTFTCATCHALQEPADDGLRRPGHPLGDAAGRPSYKNGALTELRDAVNSCVQEWMNAEPLAADDGRWVALEALLQAAAGGAPAEPLTIEIAAPPTDLAGGDPEAGLRTFDGTCAVCHGAGATGTQRAPALRGAGIDAELTARRVRLSGREDSAVYDGLTGGIMPFWASDRLSDRELRDIAAFLELEQGDDAGPGTIAGMDPATADRECDAEHPLVGATASFDGFAHDVAGTARVVDDCTIVLEDFSYDGGGIDVRVYGGVDGRYDPPTGFAMSDDIFGQRFDGGTLTVRLPEGRTLDDLNGVSIWCVAVGANFGDAVFE